MRAINLSRRFKRSLLTIFSQELFTSVGPLKKASLSFDSHGKSKGSAEVEFVRKNDALAAVKKYQGVALDGIGFRRFS